MALSLGLLSACSTTPNRAPVVERGPQSNARPEPVAPARERDERGTYTVKKGDTLIRVALEHGQNYRDLVLWNNLSNPNDIKVDQVLRVQAPDVAAPASGVQTSAVIMPPSERVLKKTTPRADKRPDAAPADLQHPDSSAAARDTKLVDKNGAAPAGAPVLVAKAAPLQVTLAAPLADEERLSWIWPTDGKVIATFDEGKNKGIDIAGRAGQQVMAAGAGKVMYAGSGIRGYGNLVIVKHNSTLLSAYAHNRSILVKEGQSVSKGQAIAEMGDSDADGVKLHFEIRQQGKPVDPSKFLPNR